nr:fibropellin-3-like [Lytechinus pictus]
MITEGLDACASDPCLNGSTCTNVGTGFECECLPGFFGTLCDMDINECATFPCQNGGTCINEVAGHSCVCQYGYTGATCEEYTLCDLEGVWYNSRNDEFTLQKTATGVIFGTYRTRGHILAGVEDKSFAFGYSVLTGEYPIPTFGLTLVRDFGRSTTCWTGQCQVCDGQEILYSTWINTQAVSTCDEIHLATRIGQDEWTRYQQLRAPQES